MCVCTYVCTYVWYCIVLYCSVLYACTYVRLCAVHYVLCFCSHFYVSSASAMYICIYIYTQSHTFTHASLYDLMCFCTCIVGFMYICLQTHFHISNQCICMHTRIYIYIYMYKVVFLPFRILQGKSHVCSLYLRICRQRG